MTAEVCAEVKCNNIASVLLPFNQFSKVLINGKHIPLAERGFKLQYLLFLKSYIAVDFTHSLDRKQSQANTLKKKRKFKKVKLLFGNSIYRHSWSIPSMLTSGNIHAMLPVKHARI